jgi:hypothetical protein
MRRMRRIHNPKEHFMDIRWIMSGHKIISLVCASFAPYSPK